VRLHHFLLLFLLGLNPATAQTAAPTNIAPATPVAPRAQPVNPLTAPMGVPGGVTVHWYGHGFVYLTSSFGIRCAIDPFGSQTVHYAFPAHLAADFVLVTHEGEDPDGQGVANTAFTVKFDGIKFCSLGQPYAPLVAREREQIGKCDVLFLPIGVQALGVADLDQMVRDLDAKMIIPVTYKTDLSGSLSLRTLDDYLAGTKFPVRKLTTDEIVVTKSSLPDKPTIYALPTPTAAAPANPAPAQ
jgi:hypothetical protein